nr:immunoglobulin heavy chain junction region [Macaca mulatta]MOY18843.1 immunoglobulin heavy chain junction region [Macaca mulatta]MOY20265.1 immunoglobulin heavy chain junction region [Macaca mulatta]MOY20417.1 immunoglobulin heavy chain junction region [Macaca mulatta]MOY20854.1 immunoglobulin heavy chain junction region [Macaca mulatta]
CVRDSYGTGLDVW